MPRRKLQDKNVRKITKSGGYSYSVTLPIELIQDLKWKQGQKVVVKRDERRKRLIIEDWK